MSWYLTASQRRSLQRKCWMDNIKEWTSLPTPDLFTRASCRKHWKRISAESSLMSPRRPSWSRDWTELNNREAHLVLSERNTQVMSSDSGYKSGSQFWTRCVMLEGKWEIENNNNKKHPPKLSWPGKKKAEILATGEAYNAIFWPIPS